MLASSSKPSDSIKQIVTQVQDDTLSWFTGSFPIDGSSNKLYIDGHQPICFPSPAAPELQRLYDIAVPVSSPDGNYRTLTSDKFAINLRPDASLLHQIKELMIKHQDPHGYVQVELSHVEIYGPSDFSHKHLGTEDKTSKDRLGSLTICLGTEFEGGSLTLRNDTENFKFGWGSKGHEGSDATESTNEPPQKKVKTNNKKQAPSPSPSASSNSVAYVATATNTATSVEAVTSGFCVLVSFRLIRKTVSQLDILTSSVQQNETYRNAIKNISKLRSSKAFKGKNIIFPVVKKYIGENSKNIKLQGGDAALFQVLSAAGLKPKLMYFYDNVVDEDEDDGGYSDDDNENDDDDCSGEADGDSKCFLVDVDTLHRSGEIYYCEDSWKCAYRCVAHEHDVIWAREKVLDSKVLTVGGIEGEGESYTVEYMGNLCIFTTW